MTRRGYSSRRGTGLGRVLQCFGALARLARSAVGSGLDERPPISISEAKTQVSKLVAQAERGEEVTIRRGDKPVVKLAASETPPASSFGAPRGQIVIADDFDQLGPEWDPYT